MANKTKEQHKQTREKILDAALELISTVGFERTTFVEIGRKSGFTRGAVHSHFKDKNQILNELIENYYLLEENLVGALLASDVDYIEVIQEICHLNFNLIFDDPKRKAIEKIILFDKFSKAKAVKKTLELKKNKDLLFLESLFSKAFEKRKHDSKVKPSMLSAKQHAFALYWYIVGLEIGWLDCENSNSEKPKYKEFINHYLSQYEK